MDVWFSLTMNQFPIKYPWLSFATYTEKAKKISWLYDNLHPGFGSCQNGP